MFKLNKQLILAALLSCIGNANLWSGAERLVVRISPSPNSAIKLARQDFLKQNPEAASRETKNEQKDGDVGAQKNNESDKVPENLKKQPITAGIEVIYSGARNFTDSSGQAEFYLSHNPKNGINVFVVKETFPNVLIKNTTDSFALWEKEKPKELAAQQFFMTRKKSTKEGWIWTVESKELPENGVIPNSAVIIKVDPKNLYVPLEKITVKGKIHTLLPEFFLLDREGIDDTILEDLGKKKLEENEVVSYNLFENLSEKTKIEDKTGKKVEISNLPD